jgi:hypothetical protein
VLTGIKNYQINITTTIKIKGRKLPQNLYKNQGKEKNQSLKEVKIRKILQKQGSRNPRHAYRGTHNELVQGTK